VHPGGIRTVVVQWSVANKPSIDGVFFVPCADQSKEE